MTDISEKVYQHGELPYWAVEKANSSRYMIEDIPLFWGLVDQSYIDSKDLEITQAESIYLPAATHGEKFDRIYDSFAAGSAFTSAWESLYEDAAAVRGSLEELVPSYTSESDYGMTLKWRKLSRTPHDAAQILNLIWTDLASFVSIGTKTGFEDSGLLVSSTPSSPSPKSSILGTRLVHRNVRVIEYKDIRYAIPAFLAMGLLIVGLAGALIMFLFCMVTRRELIHYLNQTSMGRTYTQAQDPHRVNSAWATTQWLDFSGEMILDIPKAQKKIKLRRRKVKKHKLSDLGLGSSRETLGLKVRRMGNRNYESVRGAPPDASSDLDLQDYPQPLPQIYTDRDSPLQAQTRPI